MALFARLLAVSSGSLLGLWAATQWVAWLFRYDPHLGHPWGALGAHAIYAPWRYGAWLLAYGATYPRVFHRASLLVCGGVLLGTGVAVLLRMVHQQQRQRTTYGSSRWATPAEMAQRGLFRPQGVVLGQYGRQYLRHAGPEHVLVFAPTRSGKGAGLVIPTLLAYTQSTVVYDIKGENWQLTAGWRRQFSRCLSFNPTDPASIRFNPLHEIRLGANEVRDTQNVADILVDPEGTNDRRDYWDRTGHALLVGAILHVLYAEPDKTLTGVASFLSNPAQSFSETLTQMMATPHLPEGRVHPVVASAAREMLNKSSNELSGVLSTAMSFLGLYRDPIVARATSTSDFALTDLVQADTPVSLYLVVPPSDIERTRPLIRLLLNQMGRRLTERLEGTPGASGDRRARHDLLFLLDEFPLLGRLEFFQSALAYMAGYGLRAFLVVQSLNQLDHAYGPNNAILDNCHIRVAFASNDDRTARRIADLLGITTETRQAQSHSGKRWALWLDHRSVAEQEIARPLLTPGEIMQLPDREQLVFVGGMPPIRARKIRYFADATFTRRAGLPPPACPTDPAASPTVPPPRGATL